MSLFPLIDQYLGVLLDLDIPSMRPQETVIVESKRRLRREQSYGYVHAFWGIWFTDGRTAISVPPGAGEGMREVLEQAPLDIFPPDPGLIQGLSAPIDLALKEAGLAPVKNALDMRMYACNAALVQRWEAGQCVRLCDERIPPVEGLRLPTHCFPDGIVYGVVEGGQVVSVAYAHRIGLMVNRMADLGVETAEAYQRRGYAKTVVSAVTAHMTQAGGEGLYNCSSSNTGSVATAFSVGYELYGKALILATNLTKSE